MLPDYNKLDHDVEEMLREGLDKKLHYHGFHHILYVMDAAMLIASEADLTDREILLLKTAVLLHDSGFLHTYHEHEVIGTEIASEMLPDYGYTEEDIKTINGMIMATRIPQTATNQLEEIIADADLEYLGTDQFDRISEYLYQELLEFNFIKNRSEWNRIQERFLRAHSFFTDYCKKNREEVKQKNIKRISKLGE